LAVGNQGSTGISFQLNILPGSSPAGIVDWLSVSPTVGFLDPGAETLIDVRFDSSNKPLPNPGPDLYSASIRIDSDSLSEPRVLTVTAIMEVANPTISPVINPTKAVAPDVFNAALRSRPLTYTLLVPNLGLTTTVDLVDPLPVDTAYEPASLWASSGRYGYDLVGEAITWTGVVSTGEEITIQFQVTSTRLLSDAESITNTAHLTDAEGLIYTIEALSIADGLPPVSTIVDPVAGQFISSTAPYTVEGTAVDAVSGVAEVAVSVDGGAWQPATGMKLWYYQWTGYADGEHNLRSRATDALGHVESPGAGITVTVDTVPPMLLAHRPAAGALDVPLTATVVLTFSEPILPGSLRFSCVPAPDDWSVSLDATGTVANLTPSGLARGKLYAFTVSSAHDYARNAVQPVAWSFATMAYPRTYLPLVVVNVP
jgi:hypothetical protein